MKNALRFFRNKYVITVLIVTTVFYPGFAGSIKADVESGRQETEKAAAVAAQTTRVWLTAYSSSVDETDDTPFITASGKYVRDGIVAANFLPFGTMIKIPNVFGDKIFVVEDRMHPRKNGIVDIWMSSKQAALRFGSFKADIVVLKDTGQAKLLVQK
ncbi:MAG: hypothetical protein AAB602_02330 [Patescibacteria group bacterium]